MAVSLLCFDYDGTLIDNTIASVEALRAATHILYEASLRASLVAEEENFKNFFNTIYNTCLNLEKESFYDRSMWWKEALSKMGIGLPLEVLRAATIIYWKTYSILQRPYPETYYVLSYLKKKGYKIAIITDTDGAIGLKRLRIKHVSIEPFIDSIIVAGDDVPYKKPHPLPFAEICRLLSTSPRETVYVGDVPEKDVRGILELGGRAFIIDRRGSRLWKSNDDVVYIRDLKDLIYFF